jgi:DNA-directed RNA polymerase, mitochondrial
MTDVLTPGGRLRKYGDRGYSEIRAAKREDYIAGEYGFEATKQGRALERRYLSQLTDKIEAAKRYGRRDHEVWQALKDVDDIAGRLLRAGITVAASTGLGVDRKRSKNSRDIALWIGRRLGQDRPDQQWKVGTWGADRLIELPIFRLDGNDVLTLANTAEVKELRDNVIRDAAADDSFLLPLAEPPVPWTGVWDGGLPREHWARFPLVNQRLSQTAIQRALRIPRRRRGNMWIVIDGVNAVQRVPYTINLPLFDVARKLPPLPPTPPQWLAKTLDKRDGVLPQWLEELFAENDEAADYFAACAKLVSWEMDMIMAEMLIDRGGPFYIPHRLEFRGRIMAVPLFSFQRGDHVRGLFLFANGERIGEHGLPWLKAHVAGLADDETVEPSKFGFRQRIEWVDANIARLRRVGEAVLLGEVPEMSQSIDKPVQYMAACAELTRAIDVGPDFITHLPLTFDGSCSGLQHLCAMTCSEDGRLVNLIESEEAADLYSCVAEEADKLLADRYFVLFRTGTNKKGKAKHKQRTFVTKDEADAFAATVDTVKAGHIDVKIDRAIAKRPVGTFFYGATKFGMKLQVVEALKKKKLPRDGAWQIADAIYKAVELTVPLATAVRRFMEETAKLYADANLLLSWPTPTGMPVINLVDEAQPTTFGARLAGRRVRANLIVGDTKPAKIDGAAAARSATANLTHSMDASHMHLVACVTAEEGIDMTAVHDSFGCLAPRARRLYDIIRYQFFRLYNPSNMLGDIHAGAVRDFPDADVPEPPRQGTLSPMRVMGNFHAFKS